LKVDKVFVVNILAMIVFVMAFIVGIFETGYQEMGYNLVGIFLMLFGVLGLISQFIVINISLLLKKKRI
jgi:uncharacterized membrane protein